jgi:hypothetical protein
MELLEGGTLLEYIMENGLAKKNPSYSKARIITE